MCELTGTVCQWESIKTSQRHLRFGVTVICNNRNSHNTLLLLQITTNRTESGLLL